MAEFCVSTLQQQLCPTIPTKSLQQHHSKPSASKNSQFMVTNAPTSTSTISKSYLYSNVQLPNFDMHIVIQLRWALSINSELDQCAARRCFLAELFPLKKEIKGKKKEQRIGWKQFNKKIKVNPVGHARKKQSQVDFSVEPKQDPLEFSS